MDPSSHILSNDSGPIYIGPVYIGMGSNQGDRIFYLIKALHMLAVDPQIQLGAVAPLFESKPLGDSLHHYYNTVVALETTYSPRALLAQLMRIEQNLGRVRTVKWADRTIDLDVLLYADWMLQESDYVIPHTGLLERAFVLWPLWCIAPEQIIPGCNLGIEGDLSVDKVWKRFQIQHDVSSSIQLVSNHWW